MLPAKTTKAVTARGGSNVQNKTYQGMHICHCLARLDLGSSGTDGAAYMLSFDTKSRSLNFTFPKGKPYSKGRNP